MSLKTTRPSVPDSLEGAEADQTVAATDVEHGVGGLERCAIQHLVADRCEETQGLRQRALVPAVAAVEQPLRPAVAHGASASRAFRSSGCVNIATVPSAARGHSLRGRSQ